MDEHTKICKILASLDNQFDTLEDYVKVRSICLEQLRNCNPIEILKELAYEYLMKIGEEKSMELKLELILVSLVRKEQFDTVLDISFKIFDYQGLENAERFFDILQDVDDERNIPIYINILQLEDKKTQYFVEKVIWALNTHDIDKQEAVNLIIPYLTHRRIAVREAVVNYIEDQKLKQFVPLLIERIEKEETCDSIEKIIEILVA